ncbi:hypothetical protein LINGRAHAP2_LOCUS8629, partial [Linum grandiflorum]
MVAASSLPLLQDRPPPNCVFIDGGHEFRCVQRKLMVNELPDGTVRHSSKVVSNPWRNQAASNCCILSVLLSSK